MGLLENSLEVVKLAGKIANPELIRAATAANIEALELSTKNIELQRKLGGYEAQIKELEAKLTLTGKVFKAGDFAFLDGDPDGYCLRCWEADRKLFHIIKSHFGRGGIMENGCPQCKTVTHGRGQNPHMSVAM